MCYVSEKNIEEYRADYKNQARTKRPLAFWNKFTLEFLKPSKEEVYRTLAYDSWYLQDVVAFALVSLMGPLGFITVQQTFPPWYGVFWLVWFLSIAPAAIFLYRNHRSFNHLEIPY